MVRTIAASLVAALLATTAGSVAAKAADDQDATARKERVEKLNARIEKRFTALDKNKDGSLDRAEIQATLGKAFDRMDKNHDGVLDADEIKAMTERASQRGGKAGEMAEARLKRADKNGDGKVTKEEFSDAEPRWLARADKDKNETVTKAELDAFLAHREKRAETGAGKAGDSAN
ncbi:EF-hand domain-containing protein [Hansschlegelia plantiphila]|uniref:EF-hand domain-containing protein n=1 Tax=Hansschlegelia plantiphila TaxID=374655 RepID=A0A9W6MU95_9HYPH|nr:EF-hand domain-containing protein [Hansschlegelia plantiphila]GLK66717.1 hypothetical protein GCM10008179_03550 [Hansschlegelia plantiphila]